MLKHVVAIASVLALATINAFGQGSPVPAQWNYGFVNGVSTATYSGNVQGNIVAATLNGVTIGGGSSIIDGSIANSIHYSSAIKCDGVTDDTAAIQNAINALPTTGGTLLLPQTGKPCVISDTIEIGNGTSTVASTRNAISIIGGSKGQGGQEEGTFGRGSTVLQWDGTSGGTAVKVNGPVTGIELSGISVNCNNLCDTGFWVTYAIGSQFDKLTVYSHTGHGIIIDAYPDAISGVATGAGMNVWNDIDVNTPMSGSCGDGMVMGGSSYGTGSSHNDVVQSNFNRLTLLYRSDTGCTTAAGLTLQFVDNISINGLITEGFGGSAGHGINVIPPATSGIGLQFPSEVGIVNSAILGGVNVTGTWTPSAANRGGINFLNYSMGDGETIPVATAANQFAGITTGGVYFNSISGVTDTGITCTGTPTSSFASSGGIVTHC